MALGAMYLTVLLVLSFYCCIVLGYDRSKLAKTPPLQPNFSLEKYGGQWYVQARLVSCKWTGSNEFTDWEIKSTYEPGSLHYTDVETWRSKTGQCNTMSTRLTDGPGGCGFLIVKDPIGNVLTGEQYVVATDYKTIDIVWGCIKRSVDGGHCDDPWVTLSTRQRYPSAYTLKSAEKIMQKYWDLSLSEMTRIEHKNPCSILSPSKY